MANSTSSSFMLSSSSKSSMCFCSVYYIPCLPPDSLRPNRLAIAVRCAQWAPGLASLNPACTLSKTCKPLCSRNETRRDRVNGAWLLSVKLQKCVSPVSLNLHRPAPEAWLLRLSLCVCVGCVLQGLQPCGLYLDVTRFLRDPTQWCGVTFSRLGPTKCCLRGNAVWHHSDDPRPARVVSEAKVTCCPRCPSLPETMTHSTHSWCF